MFLFTRTYNTGSVSRSAGIVPACFYNIMIPPVVCKDGWDF